MKALICGLLLVCTSLCLAQKSDNTTFAACSPINTEVSGGVNITCNNLDPVVAKRILELAQAFSLLSKQARSQHKYEAMISSINTQTSDMLERIKKIQDSLGDRHVDDAGAVSLKTNGKTVFYFISYERNDSETKQLAEQINAVLQKEDWRFQSPPDLPNTPLEMADNVRNSGENLHREDQSIDPDDYYKVGTVIINSFGAEGEAGALGALLSRSGIAIRIVKHPSQKPYETFVSIQVFSRH